jgi:hypothetical protein
VPDATSAIRTAAAWPPPLGISSPHPPRQVQETSRAAPRLLHAGVARCQPRMPLLHCSAPACAPGAQHAACPHASTRRRTFCPCASSYKNPPVTYCPCPHRCLPRPIVCAPTAACLVSAPVSRAARKPLFPPFFRIYGDDSSCRAFSTVGRSWSSP